MTLDLSHIEELAKAAERGPWHADKNALYIWAPGEKGSDFPIVDANIEAEGQVLRARGWGYYTGHGGGALGLDSDEAIKRQRANVNFIAACDPTTILAIIKELRELRAFASSVNEALNSGDGSYWP